nr:hypothetical protein [Tanacetum cinerariifolium]
FNAKDTKREVFGMPILGSLITADIREASYYQDYLENVTKHRRFLAGETRSAQDSHAPKPAKPAKKPKPTTQKDRINILKYLKFSAKDTKREVFGLPILGSLITADIREASYYQDYLANVTKHRRFLAGETRSAQDSHAPKPAKPTKKPKPISQKDRINIIQYLIHLCMCKDFPTKMMKMFLLVENIRQQNPNNHEIYIRDDLGISMQGQLLHLVP